MGHTWGAAKEEEWMGKKEGDRWKDRWVVSKGMICKELIFLNTKI